MSETKKHREFWIKDHKVARTETKGYLYDAFDLLPALDKSVGVIHVVEISALLEEKQNTKELLNTIVKFKEYFSAIESGEYNNNRRPSPLREYENVLQLQANELIKKYGDV